MYEPAFYVDAAAVAAAAMLQYGTDIQCIQQERTRAR